MDRAERIGLGVAVTAHVVLFAALSFGLMTRETEPRRQAVSVTLTDEIGEVATATDRPAPAARALERDLEAMEPEVEPVPQPRAEPTPQPRPAPRAEPRRTETPQPRRETRREQTRSGSRLSNITEGIGSSRDTGTSASDAAVSASDRSNLISRIVNAIRPCYNLGALGGTAAEDIIVQLRIRPSRDGSLSSSQVSVQGYRGVNSANREYQRQMAEAARAAVLNPRCPLPNLPDSMYDNGWSDVVLNFIPAQLT